MGLNRALFVLTARFGSAESSAESLTDRFGSDLAIE